MVMPIPTSDVARRRSRGSSLQAASLSPSHAQQLSKPNDIQFHYHEVILEEIEVTSSTSFCDADGKN